MPPSAPHVNVARALKIQPRQFGKYLLLDRIGVGGMAEIYRARQFGAAGFQKSLVIKKILQHLADNDDFVRMFIDEAKIAVSLQHANVVQIFDLGAVQREYFIAMEYVQGKDLLNLLIRCTHLRIRVPQKLAVFIVAEAVKGLEAAHNAVDSRGNPLNVIHRDVSPSNILISYEGEVKIGDFGVAKATRREATTKSGAMKGKLGYMSPEQVTGQEIDHRADLFSAGIILFEMLAMNRLFHGKTELETLMLVRDCDVEDSIAKLPETVGPELREILRRALAKDRDERFQSATEFLDALLDHLFNEKIRVTTQDMGRFMKSVFAKEIEEEVGRQEEIDEIVAQGVPEEEDAGASGDRDSYAPSPFGAGQPPPSDLSWTPDSRFRVRDRDGVIYGPMSLKTLVEIVNRDGLEVAEDVSVDGSRWVKAGDLPHLLDAPAEFTGERPTPDFTGPFTKFDFPRVVYRYAACRATGRLAFENGSKRKEIYWRRGRPEFVTSNLRSELLGEYLVERRLISRARLNEALSSLSDFGGRLGDALLHLELLTPHDLFNALSAQVKNKLLEMFGWDGGHYAFYRGEHTTAQIVPLDVGAFALVNEGVCRRMPLDDVKRHFTGQEETPLWRLDHKLISPAALKLSTKQLRIWNAVGHGVPISEQLGRLLHIPGVDEGDVYQVFFLMERLEFATISPDAPGPQ